MERDDSQINELLEVGKSPLNGIVLKDIYKAPDVINDLKWSPDGKTLICLTDKEMLFYSTQEKNLVGKINVNTLRQDNHNPVFYNDRLAYSPDGKLIAVGIRYDIYIIRLPEYSLIKIIPNGGGWVKDLSFSANSKLLASSSGNYMIKIWNIYNDKQIFKDGPFENEAVNLFWDENDSLIGKFNNGEIITWEKNDLSWVRTPDSKYNHVNVVGSCIAFYKDGFAYSEVNNIYLTRKSVTVILEGHTDSIIGLTFIDNGKILISKSNDRTIKFWDTDNWNLLGTINEHSNRKKSAYIAANPIYPLFASYGENHSSARIWRYNKDKLNGTDTSDNIRYTTAKLVLMGDSGVGKTGLGWRLAHNEYKEQDSTHGQQFWVMPELGKTGDDGTIVEAVLWDLAGQPDYRLVHSLFLDNINLALVVFDPTKRQDSLNAPLFWLSQLKKDKKMVCPGILVGGRSDRGSSTLTEDEMELFCKQNEIDGGYILTSAKDDVKIPELKEKIKALIPWQSLNITLTNTTFKKVKDYILKLKEDVERNLVLISPKKLREELQRLEKDWKFTDEEMIAAVRNLENHGYVNILRDSKGTSHFLLRPDILANLASSFVLEARRNPRGLGVLEEDKVLNDEYKFTDIATLDAFDRKILLDATLILFIEHAICFRENFNSEALLVFPSLINEKRPLIDEVPVTEDTSYIVTGPVENVYASLVVLLGYTNVFVRNNQWQNQAQYQVAEGEICGFKQVSEVEGKVEFIHYYSANVQEYTKTLFQGLFERFLNKNGLDIQRYTPVACNNCHEPLDRNVMMQQLDRGKNFSFCNNCGEKLVLPNPEVISRAVVIDDKLREQQDIAIRRTAYESALVNVKGLVRDKPAPTCFISYAWGNSEDEKWVSRLAQDLRNAGIDVLFDRWHNPPGASISTYIENIDSSMFTIVVGTPLLRQKYENSAKDAVVTAELAIINTKTRKPITNGRTVIPLLLKGDSVSSFNPILQDLVSIDFRNEEYYFYQLLSVIWTLNGLPFDNPIYHELQKTLKP